MNALFFKIMILSALFIALVAMVVARVSAETMVVALVLLGFLFGIAYMLWIAYS